MIKQPILVRHLKNSRYSPEGGYDRCGKGENSRLIADLQKLSRRLVEGKIESYVVLSEDDGVRKIYQVYVKQRS